MSGERNCGQMLFELGIGNSHQPYHTRPMWIRGNAAAAGNGITVSYGTVPQVDSAGGVITFHSGVKLAADTEVSTTNNTIDSRIRVDRFRRPDAPTVRKRRFVNRFLNQKMFEVTFLDDRPIDQESQDRLVRRIEKPLVDDCREAK